MSNFFKKAISFGVTRAALKKFKNLGGKLKRPKFDGMNQATFPQYDLPAKTIVLPKNLGKSDLNMHAVLKPRKVFMHEFGHSLDALKGKKRSRRRFSRAADKSKLVQKVLSASAAPLSGQSGKTIEKMMEPAAASKTFKDAINIEYAANRNALKFLKKKSKTPKVDIKSFRESGTPMINTYKAQFLQHNVASHNLLTSPKGETLLSEGLAVAGPITNLTERSYKSIAKGTPKPISVPSAKSIVRKLAPTARKVEANVYLKNKKLLHQDLAGQPKWFKGQKNG